eukprot:TRINITY_DN5385_c0_g1_i1.p1 TRINITY_DN5385_c0_g1~~TRINITY_DN5385_c0_g1_i1.p1  ORF type:complete len:219 (+),score=48.50 TRINITY_DN5385_c0_g1_i1:48-704(+)
MSIKIVYFPAPGRVEPIRLALILGGVTFEDQRVSSEQWGALKKVVEPKQLPLMYIGDKVIGQSAAQMRYAGRISKFEGKPLYPTDPLLALQVDEFVDYVSEMHGPMATAFKMQNQDEKRAFRAKAFATGGDIHKWISYVDSLLGKSRSGFAVGDHLTIADLATFCWYQPLKSGFFDGLPVSCFDEFKNIEAHKRKIASIPAVKAYYAEPKMFMYNHYQ